MGSEDEAEQSLGRPSRQATAGPSGHAAERLGCQLSAMADIGRAIRSPRRPATASNLEL
jgi:hypothetical protein